MDSLPSYFAGLKLNPPSNNEGIHPHSTFTGHTYNHVNTGTTSNEDADENLPSAFGALNMNGKSASFRSSSFTAYPSINYPDETNHKDAFSFGVSSSSSYKGTKKIIKNKSTTVPPPVPPFSNGATTTTTTTTQPNYSGASSFVMHNNNNSSSIPTERISSPDITFTRIPHANTIPSSSASPSTSSPSTNGTLPPKIVGSNSTVSPYANVIPASDSSSFNDPKTIPTNPYGSNRSSSFSNDTSTNIPSSLPPRVPSSYSSSSTTDPSNDNHHHHHHSDNSTMDYSPLPVPNSSHSQPQPGPTTANDSSTIGTTTTSADHAFSFGRSPPKKDYTVPKRPLSKDVPSTTFSEDNPLPWSPMGPNISSTSTSTSTATSFPSSPPYTFPSTTHIPPPPPSFDSSSPTTAFSFSPGFLNKKSDSASKKKFPKKAVPPPSTGVAPPNVPTTSSSSPSATAAEPFSASSTVAPKLTPVKAVFSSNISPPTTPSDTASPLVKRIPYEELISTARSAFTNQDFALAHKKFTDALAIKPNDAMSLSNRAACAMMLGRHDEAIVDCSRATDVDASYSPAYLRCSRAYLALGEINAAMEQAEAAEVAALNTGGNSGAKHREQARNLAETIKAIIVAENNADSAIRRKAWGQALDTIALAVSAHNEARNSLRGIMLKARAFVGLRKYQEATDLCSDTLPPQLEGANEFLACRPRPSSTAMNTAVIFAHSAWCTEDTDRALRIIAAILRVNTNHTFALRLQKRIEYCEANRKAGNEKYRNGDYRKSIELYTIAIDAATKIVPNDDDDEEDENNDTTDDSVQEQKYGSAGIPCFPARANLYANRAAAYMALTEYDSAINDCTAALDDVSMHLKARLRRARIYTVSKKFTLAFTDYRAVLTSLRSGQTGIPVGGKLDVNIENIQKEFDEANRSYRLEQEEEKRRKQEEENRRRQQQQSRYTSYRYSSQYGEYEEEEDDEDDGEDDDDNNYGWYQRNFSSQRNSTNGSNGGRSKQQQYGYTSNQQSTNRPGYGSSRTTNNHNARSTRYVPPPIPPCPPDHYSVLGVDKHFTDAVLKKAYRLKALSTHPDKPGGSEEAFKKVGEAYAVLSDYTKRLAHDADVEDWKRKYGGRR